MKRGFYTIMAAQFFSSLADNALLIAAIAQLLELDGPAWMVPLLKFFFTVSYVALAAFVGAFADAISKGRVMFITNTIKVVGCVMMFFTDYVEFAGIPGYALVLAAYAVVGFGAAAYSPAKYGILTELLPPEKLVAANGWIEGLTVASIILGTVLGGALISPRIASLLLSIDMPHIDTGVETPAEAAIIVISGFYVIAAIFNLFIPDTGARYGQQQTNPVLLMRDFYVCLTTLWKDKLGQISLAVTTLFWGAGATLQFSCCSGPPFTLVFPWTRARYSRHHRGGRRDRAVIAGRFISLRHCLDVLPAGVAMGVVVLAMIFVTSMPVVYTLLIVIGAMAGFFRGADECAVAAPRLRAPVRGPFDRSAEFQREHLDPPDACHLFRDDQGRPPHQHHHRGLRGVRRGRDARCDPAPPVQPEPRRFAPPHRNENQQAARVSLIFRRAPPRPAGPWTRFRCSITVPRARLPRHARKTTLPCSTLIPLQWSRRPSG